MTLRETILNKLTSRRNPRSLSSIMRRKRLKILLKMITAWHRAEGNVRILDIGGTQRYWNVIPRPFLKKNCVCITLLNNERDEDFILDPLFELIIADGCNLEQFCNQAFHIGHSNSVIEHLNGTGMRKKFSNEIRRVSRSLYIQIPNYWFPVEPHFVFPGFQWLPRSMRVFLRLHFNLGYYIKASTRREAEKSVDNIKLLTTRSMQEFFPDCKIVKYKFMGLTKSIVALRSDTFDNSYSKSNQKN